MAKRQIPRSSAKKLELVPHWFRPKLTPDQVRDVAIIHVSNVDEVHSGVATEQTLWDMVINVLAWSHVADLRGIGMPEISPQLQLVATLVERYGRTGEIRFEREEEYSLAKYGIQVMDQFAVEVDQVTAQQAIAWATGKANEWRTAFQSRVAAKPPQPANSVPKHLNIVFLTGDRNPLGLDDNERRFWVVEAPVASSQDA